MSAENKNCLINESDCGRIEGDPVCPKCGMDERVVYPGHSDLEASLTAAQMRYMASTNSVKTQPQPQPQPQPRFNLVGVGLLVVAVLAGGWWFKDENIRLAEADKAGPAKQNDTPTAIPVEATKAPSISTISPVEDAESEFDRKNREELVELRSCSQGETRSVSQAFKNCIEQANLGSKVSALIVGEGYAWGKFGIPESKKTALKYFEIAARSGHADAIYRLGSAYSMSSSSEKLEPNVLLSWELICKAANMKYPRAMYSCSLQLKDTDKAAGIAMMTEAAEMGEINAMGSLGSMYQQGRIVNVDSVRALYWLTKAANAGDRQACDNLAFSYEKGDIFQKNIEEAKAWRSSQKCPARR